MKEGGGRGEAHSIPCTVGKEVTATDSRTCLSTTDLLSVLMWSTVLFPEKTQWDGRLFASPWPMLGIVGVYLYFVLRAGPRMMANKPPYSLRGLVLGYNGFIVITLTWGFLKLNRLAYGQFFSMSCRPESLNRQDYDEMTDIGYLYFLSKLVELLDTVFFILKKKVNQASPLHIYHHTNMALLTWVLLTAVPAGQLLIIVYGNTFVHILIYTYYFLSALGPAMQKYLWWKKYLIKMEIIQFIIMVVYMAMLLLHPGCQISKEVLTIATCNAMSFLVLFIFLFPNYHSKKEAKL